jgi:hypothetical protein
MAEVRRLEKEAQKLAFEEKKRDLAKMKQSIQEKQRQEQQLVEIEKRELAEKAKRASRIGFGQLDPYALPEPLPSRPAPQIPTGTTAAPFPPPPPPVAPTKPQFDLDEILGGLPSSNRASTLFSRARLLNPLAKPGGAQDQDQAPREPPPPVQPDPVDMQEAEQARRIQIAQQKERMVREEAIKKRTSMEAHKKDMLMRQVFGDF